MDGDPDVESALDAFSLVLPLPYRVSIILVAGLWAWAINLHYLHRARIVSSRIRLSSRSILTTAGCPSPDPPSVATEPAAANAP